MSYTVHISSPSQFDQVLERSKLVIANFFAERSGPCKQTGPLYEEISLKLSRPDDITFCKINVDHQKELARIYGVTTLPTFMVFKNTIRIDTVQGADYRGFIGLVTRVSAEAEGKENGFGDAIMSSAGGSGTNWLGVDLPRGYRDVTDQVDVRGLDLLNSDPALGSARELFSGSAPLTLGSYNDNDNNNDDAKGKDKAGDSEKKVKDWVESDSDEQLMLFMPFHSTLKIHTLHITSLPPTASQNADNNDATPDIPLRPKTIQIYSNRAHVLGFEEAEGIPATQTVTLRPQDWDPTTGTAKMELRFVKFQNVTSLVMFVVDGEGEGERVRIDRLRIMGEAGERREMGRLEKIGESGD